MPKTLIPQPTGANVRLVPLAKIKAATWNPSSRVEKRRLKNLQASIEDIGLIYPVVIDEDHNLVDGHRRKAVAETLGWTALPCIQITSEFQHAYGSIQANQERLTGNELIGVYLSNPRALLNRQLNKIGRVEDACGAGTLTKLYRAGLTAGTFDIAMRVVRYTDSEVEPKAATEWLIRHSMGGTMRHLLDAGIPKTKIVKAIKENSPLKVTMTAE